ncbi:hypothetical protein, partial [Burkholderia gladioli]|uniref:hypothetical protein n=1 Tax=Burkholderia gladioli TaxID=28095 RepID=UPI001ABAD1C0
EMRSGFSAFQSKAYEELLRRSMMITTLVVQAGSLGDQAAGSSLVNELHGRPLPRSRRANCRQRHGGGIPPPFKRDPQAGVR